MTSASPTSIFSGSSPLGTATSTFANVIDDGTVIFAQEMTIYQKNGTQFNLSSQNLMVEVTKRYNEQHREVVVIQISKENDLFFNFTYQVDSREFDKLQQGQQLSISFKLFPEMLKSLLDKCAAACYSSSLLSNDKSSHILCLEYHSRNSLRLEIIERDKYQNIRRLAFDIPAACEEDIRTKYREIYQRFRRENERLHERVATLESDNHLLKQTNSELVKNYNQDLSSHEKSARTRVHDLEQKYQEERDKWQENERILKAKFSKLTLELQSKEDALKCERQKSGSNHEELKEKYSHELAKKNARIKELEEQNKQQTVELEYLKGLREKTSLASKMNELELDDTKKDLSKANEIIRKLQEEVKSGREKLEILNQVTHKQEANLSMKESTLDKVSCELKVCLQQLTKKKNEMERLEAELERFRSKCSQSELQIKANKAVIGKLNEQLMLQAEAMETVKRRLVDEAKTHKTLQSQSTEHITSSNHLTDRIQNGLHLADLRGGGVIKGLKKSTAGGKNVDFVLDDEHFGENSKARPQKEDADLAAQQDNILKNHLFANTKERPLFREVNLRTSHKTKGGSSNSNNVMPTSNRRTHMF